MWAWEVLRGRLSERRRAEEQEAQSAVRLSQVKSGNRSDKVRTYNFQQDRVTDHRIGFSAGNLEGILAGEGLMIMIDALKQDLAERRLEALMLGEPDLIE
jgi:peptide chain release factor 1